MGLLGAAALSASVLAYPIRQDAAKDVTFSADVKGILQENCLRCHRPDGIGPFSMLTYRDVRPWARAIKQVFLSNSLGTHSFLIDRKEIETLVLWADTGAKEGAADEVSVEPAFADRWQIGAPDLVVAATKPYKLPASGADEETTADTGYVFTQDTWIQALEIRPSTPQAVHHAYAVVERAGETTPLHLYSPGADVVVFRDGYARLIPKGSRIRLQMHYTTIGRAVTDEPRVALRFAQKPVHTGVRTEAIPLASLTPLTSGRASGSSAGPSSSAARVVAAWPVPGDARIYSVRAHVQAGGRDSVVTIAGPSSSEEILSVPLVTGFWQYYEILEHPVEAAKGWTLQFSARGETRVDPDAKPSAAAPQSMPQQPPRIYVNWVPLNEDNRNDREPIQIPPSLR